MNKRISSLGDEQEEGEFNAYEIEQLKLYEKLMEEECYEEENS